MQLSGNWFKLVEPGAAYLGVLMVPEWVSADIESRRERGDAVQVARRAHWSAVGWCRNASNDSERSAVFLIAPIYRQDDALALIGITPEEISAEPGFAFLPSAEYLRRSAPKAEVSNAG